MTQPPTEPPSAYKELSDLTGKEPVSYLDDPGTPPATPPRNPLIVGLLVLALLFVITITAFQLLRPRDSATTADDGLTTLITAAGSEPDTTLPPTTVSDDAPDATAPAATIVPVGEPIPLEDLQLAVNSIGPIAFGTAADQALGRLVASLGDPDDDTGPILSTGEHGSCVGVMERVVRFGPLSVLLNDDAEGVSVLAGYRLDLSAGAFISPAINLTTLSGLKGGDTIDTLEDVYSGFVIEYVEHDQFGEVYELHRRADNALLLWGPITSRDPDGQILGIFSPDPCPQGG